MHFQSRVISSNTKANMVAAAGAAASASSFALYSPQRFLSFSPSFASKSLQTNFLLKPISNGRRFSISVGIQSSPILIQSRKRCGFAFRASQSPEVSSPQSDDEDDNAPFDLGSAHKEEDESSTSSLESVLSAYKEAILNGDLKTISDVEALLYEIEKDKHELLAKVSSLSEEISSAKDKYIRLQADFDNYRKRSEKEKLTIRSDAQGEIIERLLPMVDNFERAKQHLKLETEQEKSIDASYQGIYKQFVEIIKSLDVSAVPTVGNPFDPLIHEAIAREESQEFEEGIVIQEFRRGFILDDRLLRPAMVKVSSGPSPTQASSVANESLEQPTTIGVDDREFSEQSTG